MEEVAKAGLQAHAERAAPWSVPDHCTLAVKSVSAARSIAKVGYELSHSAVLVRMADR